MVIQDIVRRINVKLAGEMLSYSELEIHLDSVIDDINSQLNTIYPAFSEIDKNIPVYDMFDDKWIRQVVVPGAAWYYFVADEEGMATAEQFGLDYQKGLYMMLRDTVYEIPEEYAAPTEQGSIDTSDIWGKRGLFLNGADLQL